MAAALATDWGDRIGLDIIVTPSSPEELVEEAWQRGLAVVKEDQPPIVEVMIDDDLDVGQERDERRIVRIGTRVRRCIRAT